MMGADGSGRSPGARAVMNMCAAGNHDYTKKYGVCGIITAIICFPCGLICLLCVYVHSRLFAAYVAGT